MGSGAFAPKALPAPAQRLLDCLYPRPSFHDAFIARCGRPAGFYARPHRTQPAIAADLRAASLAKETPGI